MRNDTDNMNRDALSWDTCFPSLVGIKTRASSNPGKTQLLNASISEYEYFHFKGRASTND